MVRKRLKTRELIWFDKEHLLLLVRVYEHGPWCSDGCTFEGGCTYVFDDDDIVDGSVEDVYEHPEHYKMRYFNGEPFQIMKVEWEEEVKVEDLLPAFFSECFN